MNWRVHLRRTRRAIGRPLARVVMPGVLRLLSKTWKSETLGAENLERAAGADGGHFMALWHGRMILSMPIGAHKAYHVLVSPSGDGDLSQAMLGRFGYHVLRGSTSRGGAQALRAMLELLRGGATLVITPDGPRGPRHSMNAGLAWMARATGHPIVPCGFVCDRAWRVKSWDRMTIPKPGARVVTVYGEPIHVSRDGGDDELEAATNSIRERMLEAEQLGFERLGVERDW
ncbi:MAG: lysophospholipid acyltransferase family protein [Planctomycetes bacterium]|nr:lysophospholipid acyltransferase family protein [Planctomycetota bacterium]